MGLDFGKSSMGNPAQAGNGLQEKNEIEVVEKYDIVADRQQMNAELVNSSGRYCQHDRSLQYGYHCIFWCESSRGDFQGI